MYQLTINEFFLKTSGEPVHKELESLVQRNTRKSNDQVCDILDNVDVSQVTDASGTTLLHMAASFCNMEIMKYMIERGCDVDAQNNCGQTPLMIALNSGFIDMIEVLLDAYANIYICDSSGQSPLQIVLKDADIPCPSLVDMFLQRALKDCKSIEQMVERLREIDCPLNCLVCMNEPEITRKMLEREYYPVIGDPRYSNTPLHIAVFAGNTADVKLLLEYGANVNAVNADGETPMMLNSFNRRDGVDLAMLEMLLKHGADLKALDRTGKFQVSHVLTRGKRRSVRMLLDYGLDLQLKDDQQCTPAFYMIVNDNPRVIRELKNRPIDWNARNAAGSNLLHTAMSRGDPNIVRFLVARGVDVNARDNIGRTPVFYATIPYKPGSHKRCIEILIQHGAELEIVSQNGDTLVDIACTPSNMCTIEPIIAHLALVEELGKQISEPLRFRIYANVPLYQRFIAHRQQLQIMRTQIVYGTVTMFKILTEPDDKIAVYARIKETAHEVAKCCDAFDSYYYEVIRKRFARAQDVAHLRMKAELVLDDLLGNLDGISYERIISFLDYADLQKFRAY